MTPTPQAKTASLLAGCALIAYGAITTLGLAIAGSVGALAGLNVLWLLLPATSVIVGFGLIARVQFARVGATLVMIAMIVIAALSWVSVRDVADMALSTILSLFPLGIAVALFREFVRNARRGNLQAPIDKGQS